MTAKTDRLSITLIHQVSSTRFLKINQDIFNKLRKASSGTRNLHTKPGGHNRQRREEASRRKKARAKLNFTQKPKKSGNPSLVKVTAGILETNQNHQALSLFNDDTNDRIRQFNDANLHRANTDQAKSTLDLKYNKSEKLSRIKAKYEEIFHENIRKYFHELFEFLALAEGRTDEG